MPHLVAVHSSHDGPRAKVHAHWHMVGGTDALVKKNKYILKNEVRPMLNNSYGNPSHRYDLYIDEGLLQMPATPMG